MAIIRHTSQETEQFYKQTEQDKKKFVSIKNRFWNIIETSLYLGKKMVKRGEAIFCDKDWKQVILDNNWNVMQESNTEVAKLKAEIKTLKEQLTDLQLENQSLKTAKTLNPNPK